MSKEVNLTFRVEPDLRSRFAEAAELEHRPAAQVLRDLMREYVEKSRQRADRPQMSASERQRRQEAVSYGRASVGLEGFKLAPEDERHAQRFIDGEIELAEFVRVRHRDPAPER